MNEIENFITNIEANQKDQANQMLQVKRIINLLQIKSAFINLSNDGFICYYTTFKLDKVCVNTKEVSSFNFNDLYAINLINYIPEKVMISGYDLIHISLTLEYNNISSFIGRMESCARKCLIVSYTTQNKEKSSVVNDYLDTNGWILHYTDNQYYGMNIYKKK